MIRRNEKALPWLRAVAFAGVTFLALRATGFYPGAVPPVLALVTGALGVFAPGVAVLVFLLAAGLPLLAGDIVVGAIFIILGFSAIQYLSEDDARAFLVVALGFAAALVRAEWAVAALAGYVLGASDGAIVAFVACLAIQSAGFVFGLEHVGVLATGGTRPLVDLAAIFELGRTTNTLAFGWLAPSLARIDVPAAIRALTGIRDVLAFAAQPFLWAAGAALSGVLRRPVADPKRTPFGFVAAWAGVVATAAGSIGLVVLLGARVPLPSMGIAAAVSLVAAAVGVAVSEFVFTPTKPSASSTAADDADVDELLRMISSAEEELASKHTMSRTVLITDMKSFSRMTQELGSAETAKLVQRHRDLLLPVVEKHGGRGKSTGGDGLLAAFESPAEAIAAAAEMQQALAAYNAKRQGEETVLIRAGAAIGEVVLDKSGKPFLGDALNLAARIMSLADGGQVFTSRTVLERAGGPSFGAVSHGTFRLKNIAEPIEIVEILWSADQTARAPRPAAED
jgi:class 3 adenylate cyclase